MAKQRKFGWPTNVTLIIVVVIIIIFAAVVARLYAQSNISKLETQAKDNLHQIHIAVERYAVDALDGNYPPYLIGGEPGSTGADMASDPLLREGYFAAYPKNPFHRPRDQFKGLPVLELQKQLSKSTAGTDPLRPGSPDGDKYGYRFGKDGTRMGQVLCEARWRTRTDTDPETREEIEYPTWADVEYRFWDMWVGKKPQPYIPGGFFYKGIGPLHTVPEDFDDKKAYILPCKARYYVLGVYGSRRSPGQDVLGGLAHDKPFVVVSGGVCLSVGQKYIFQPYLGSELDPAAQEGSPFRLTEGSFSYGNPNGIRDGIIDTQHYTAPSGCPHCAPD